MRLFDRYLLNTTALHALGDRARAAPVDDADPADTALEDDDNGEDTDAGDDFEDEAAEGGEDDGAGGESDAERAEAAEREAQAPVGRQGERQQGERRPSRASDRIRSLADQNADLKRRLDDMETRSRAPQQQFQPQRTPQEEREFLATMTVEERTDYRVTQALNQHNLQTQHIARNLQNQSDQADFNNAISASPKLKRYADEVENRYRRLQSEGNYLPRRAILTYLIGERAMAKVLLGERPGRQSAAAERVRRQQTRPASNRGDVQASRNARGARSLEERLADVPI